MNQALVRLAAKTEPCAAGSGTMKTPFATGDLPRVWLYSFWVHFLRSLSSPMSHVTRILSAIQQGHPHAADELLPLVYDELRTLATQRLAQEKPGQTLQATALVHEAYLRLVGAKEGQVWDSRGHFFAAAAQAMRRILLNRARDKKRIKRGGERKQVDLDQIEIALDTNDEQLVALDEALGELAVRDPEAAQLVDLRFLPG